MIGKDLRMKDMDKVGQNNFRFDRHLLIERHNFHVAIDYPMIFPCVKSQYSGCPDLSTPHS